MGTGYIVLPAAIEPVVATSTPEGTPSGEPTPISTTPPASAIPTQPAGTGGATISQTRVDLHLRLTRPQLYASFNALANLADRAGTIHLNVSAESLQGFDPVWLRNAVIEPLDEAGVETDS